MPRNKTWRRGPYCLRTYRFPHGEARVELRGLLPPLVFLTALVWYCVAPSAAAMMLWLGSGGALLAGFLWARALALGVRAKRSLLYSAMQVGDELEEAIQLKNNASVPAHWAEFVDRSNLPGHTVSGVRGAGAGQTVAWRARSVCTRRGVFQLGPWELRLGDPLGLFQTRQIYDQPEQVLVYPPLAEVPRELLAHHSLTGDQRLLRQPVAAETVTAAGARPYQPGDPSRRVHWPTTARRGELFVRAFEPEAASRLWLVTDTDVRAHCGEGAESSFEAMITAAASFGAEWLRQGLQVGWIGGLEPELILPPRRGTGGVWDLVRALAPVQPGEGDLASLLARLGGVVTGRDLLVIFTPSTAPAWQAALARLARPAQVMLLDADSFRERPESAPGGVDRFVEYLTLHGAPAHALRRGDLKPMRGVYGPLSRWEFKVLGTGRAVARQSPRLAARLGGKPEGGAL